MTNETLDFKRIRAERPFDTTNLRYAERSVNKRGQLEHQEMRNKRLVGSGDNYLRPYKLLVFSFMWSCRG
jgi:hypothetical protein